MPHQVHADVDADEAEAGVHDGELEGVVDGEAGDDHEVGRVADDEPGARAGLRGDHPVAEEGSAQLGACGITG